MRKLTQAEIDIALDDNGEKDDGAVAIEATVGELAALGVGTCCGRVGNKTFQVLADKGYQHRKCRGWFDEKDKVVVGMFHIKIQTDKTAQKVEESVCSAGGSLRHNGDSMWGGYKEFEIE